MASPVLTAYLALYNAVSAAGWAYVLYLTLDKVYEQYTIGSDVESIALVVYRTVHVPLQVVQSAAMMEILHSLLGFVRSPVSSTVMQVGSRLWLVWAINYLCPSSRATIGLPMMVTSWALVEVPRYSFYTINLYTKPPAFLTFLRYHLFMVLYPSGVLGEVLCMLSALPDLETGIFSVQMPNKHNISISLYMLVILTLLVYIPGLPVMYSHMLVQRNRAYGKSKKE